MYRTVKLDENAYMLLKKVKQELKGYGIHMSYSDIIRAMAFGMTKKVIEQYLGLSDDTEEKTN